MRALVIALLFLPLVAAHAGNDHGDDEFVVTGTGGLSIAVAIDEQQLVVHPDTTAWVDVVVLIGERNATTPDEWYVLHLGNASVAVDRHGAVQQSNGTIQRTGGAGGDCVVVAGQTWHRQDSQRVVLDSAPAGLDDLWTAWGDGTACIDAASAPAAAVDQDSPVPFVVATIALISAALLRRR